MNRNDRERDDHVQILLTNDDGIYAPGLAALEHELRRLGEVVVVAPHQEQSGVSHSITYLTPLIVEEVYEGDRLRGWVCQGSPADCVKIGITEFCARRPDLVVSGINNGLNAGINVLYSGTVAAAIEGAFFGITSIAVSLEHEPHAPFAEAARVARRVIEKILAQTGPEPQLYNLNLPLSAVRRALGTQPGGPPPVRVVPMGVVRYGERYERRVDPRGRSYYWARTEEPAPDLSGQTTDLSALAKGDITLTPLGFDLTRHGLLKEMAHWDLSLGEPL